jgi:hypothetical protein
VINHPLLFAIGTIGWLIALIVLVTLQATGTYQAPEWIAVCAVGAGLGVIAIIYSRFSWRARRPVTDNKTE